MCKYRHSLPPLFDATKVWSSTFCSFADESSWVVVVAAAAVGRQHYHWPPIRQDRGRRPPVLLSLKQVASARYERATAESSSRDASRTGTARRAAPTSSGAHRPTSRLKWCCHSPPAPLTESLVPLPHDPVPPLSGLGCRGGSADVEPASQRSTSRRQAPEKKMKCFSRYLPYIFRPPSTILSSTCHTEGRAGRRRAGGGVGGCRQRLRVALLRERVTWMFRMMLPLAQLLLQLLLLLRLHSAEVEPGQSHSC